MGFVIPHLWVVWDIDKLPSSRARVWAWLVARWIHLRHRFSRTRASNAVMMDRSV